VNILILEPFFSGSHKKWAEGYQANSQHQVEILSMPGRHWKWRMHGGAITLAKQFLNCDLQPDLILASDMLDLAAFQALTRQRTSQTPFACYFHENQLNYPWASKDPDVLNNRDMHYSFINITSALAGDAVYFNSLFHLNSFLVESEKFLQRLPDPNEKKAVEGIAAKSQVLPVGLDLEPFVRLDNISAANNEPPIILWNHRWEHDKNFDDFFHALLAIQKRGLDFQLVVLGEHFGTMPNSFREAQAAFSDRIIHWGYVESTKEYASWLMRSDILPVTSRQEFFGISVLEAVYAGCIPLMPKRLSYPELFPNDEYQQLFYDSIDDLIEKLSDEIINRRSDHLKEQLRQVVEKFSWSQIAAKYDSSFAKLL
jgi:glycosyltransferase involved in cell wall biosynthesis